ncbi:translation initiation factor IF-2 [Desulfospira joergensenii]|uniref:translation initiation factor IF-2 n=1 Tax=Desulfospira joergensenii TaxID=53329 RepID=UPI0003B794CF|nr:translation initiation factor IF-2 [Desulfospira joergensenii]
MAKVRVYELAKDLNMTNRALLNKMKELKIEVKSHMSSLEDSSVRAIRQSLFGKKKRKQDVKVKPSVIRRRKTTTESEPVSDTEVDESEVAEEEVTAPEVETEQALPAQDSGEQDSADEPVAESKESSDPEESEDQGKAPKKVTKSKTRKSEPAKIVKPAKKDEPSEPDLPEPEPEEEERPAPEAEEVEEAKEKSPARKTAESAGKEEEVLPASDEPAAEEEKENQGKEDTEEAAQAAQKKKKKKKKTTPAKIVKVADPVVLENLQKMKPSEDRKRGQVNRERQTEPRRTSPRKDAGGPVPGNLGVPPMPGDPDPAGRKKDRRREAPGSEFPGKRKRRKKKSVVEGDALYDRGRKKRGKKESRGKKGGFQKTQITTPKAIKRRVKIDEAVELAELAKRMGIKANEMIAKLMGMGVMATVNQTIDFETASLVAAEFDFEVEKASFEEDTLINMPTVEDDEGNMIERAPVVTIMGHVDHGKTSLLDVIRESKITSGEAGGITQHIGAYNVQTSAGGRITFLDTPGHAAFTAMRSRGAQVTDIVILVVAADDGVMPQTVEAINHSKAAGVPVVVAVNKMDKAGADPDRIMRELSEYDLLSEEWGGSVIFVKVSAKTGQGIDELLEMVLLQSEVLELKANPDRNASGYVVESRLDTGRGAVATVLVKQGTLRDGDPVVCGLHSGRIRAMIDDEGNRIEDAGPSTPAEIVGLNGVPDAGDEFIAVASDKDAKQIAGHRMQKQRAKELAKKSRANLEKMFENLGSAEIKELKLIVKADVQGSIEALNDSLKDLAKEEVDVKIVHSGTGTINESDVALAGVSDAIIIGFNVRPTPQIRKMAKDENVDMRFYDIIYDVINDIKAALDGMMPSTFHEIIIGRADVRDTFVVPKIGTIAGCHIAEGKVIRGKKVRLLRDGIIKCDTELSSLRRFKDDVKEVEQGYECGIGLEKFNDIKVGDAIECYEVEERKYKAE